ncbi:MAG: HDOD domain-containing protein [Gammaproteobacteria bacterium]|nr:HDOD domain-containing protein [Gammaproteobacteria bacterium]MBU2477771.1 HDOD domain-containing protein [Gammaproteobacteria bacterium]
MHPRDLVHDNVQLLSMPEVCLRIQQLADNPYADMAEFGQLVIQDPALTTRLLKLVNSAYYGFPGRVDTISRAVNLVGIAELRNLTLAMAAMEVFGGLENEHFDMLGFWRHSVYCALVARFLAKQARVLHAERLFIAGLLHDVGRLLIFSLLPDESARIQQRMNEGEEVCAAERGELGFDHAQVGYELLSLWQIPKELRIAVAFHHLPDVAEEARLEATLVALANQIAHQVETLAKENATALRDPFGGFTNPRILDDTELPIIEAIPAVYWTQAGLSAGVVNAAVAATAADFDEVLNILYSV